MIIGKCRKFGRQSKLRKRQTPSAGILRLYSSCKCRRRHTNKAACTDVIRLAILHLEEEHVLALELAKQLRQQVKQAEVLAEETEGRQRNAMASMKALSGDLEKRQQQEEEEGLDMEASVWWQAASASVPHCEAEARCAVATVQLERAKEAHKEAEEEWNLTRAEVAELKHQLNHMLDEIRGRSCSGQVPATLALPVHGELAETPVYSPVLITRWLKELEGRFDDFEKSILDRLDVTQTKVQQNSQLLEGICSPIHQINFCEPTTPQ